MDILHDERKQKFYCLIDGLESHMRYRSVGEQTLDFYHTYVPPKLRGQHIAHALVNAAADYAKDNDLRVIPSCPYVALFFRRHQAYAEMVASTVRSEEEAGSRKQEAGSSKGEGVFTVHDS